MRLDLLTPSSVVTAPFPHVVVENALDDETCRRLVRELPPLEVLTQGRPLGSNVRHDYNAVNVMRDPRLSPIWKQVIGEFVSPLFFDRFLAVFGTSVAREYPTFGRRFGDPANIRVGIRNLDHHPHVDVLLDAQIGINTPVVDRASAVRGPHLDHPTKLFAGLLYLRLDEDDSTGGDLELYSQSAPGRFDRDFHIGRDRVAVERRVPYRRNTLVLFLNTPRTLHGVTPRSVTPHPRVFINLVGVLRQPLYRVRRTLPVRERLAAWQRRMFAPGTG